MKRIFLIVFTLIITSHLLSGCGRCNYSESKVKIESLSNTQWENIFNLIEEKAKNSSDDGTWKKHQIDLGDLNSVEFISFEIFNERANINVGGCVDNKLYLHFTGINNSEEKIVKMSWGDPVQSKILWKK